MEIKIIKEFVLSLNSEEARKLLGLLRRVFYDLTELHKQFMDDHYLDIQGEQYEWEELLNFIRELEIRLKGNNGT